MKLEPDLSILICSLIERRELLDDLLFILLPQVEGKNIELLIFIDNAKRSVGEKRNNVLDVAKGRYLCFIDDDDRISSDYIDSILNEIYNSKPDVIVFNMKQTTDDKEPKLMKFGLEYDHCEKEGVCYRLPNHLMVYKRSIITEHFRDVNFGEDWEWALRMKQKIVTQSRIDKVLYYYEYRTTTKKYFNKEDVRNNYKLFEEKKITLKEKKKLDLQSQIGPRLEVEK